MSSVRHVDVRRRLAISGLEGLVPPYDVVNQIIHEQQTVWNGLGLAHGRPPQSNMNAPIDPGSFSALSSIHFCIFGCTCRHLCAICCPPNEVST